VKASPMCAPQSARCLSERGWQTSGPIPTEPFAARAKLCKAPAASTCRIAAGSRPMRVARSDLSLHCARRGFGSMPRITPAASRSLATSGKYADEHSPAPLSREQGLAKAWPLWRSLRSILAPGAIVRLERCPSGVCALAFIAATLRVAVFRHQLACAVMRSCGEMPPGESKVTASGDYRFLRYPVKLEAGRVSGHESRNSVAANCGRHTAVLPSLHC